MIRFIFYILLIFLSFFAKAQYKYDWEKYIGANAMEIAVDVINTSDGNILILGSKRSYKEGLWLVKITPSGQKVWTKTFYEYHITHPVKVIETKDKGLLIVSNVAEKNQSRHKIWLLRLNVGGEKMWERLYENQYNGQLWATSVDNTLDTGFIISGYVSDNLYDPPDFYILKVDSLGFFQWQQSFGSPYDDRLLDVVQLPDSSFFFVGYESYNKGSTIRAILYRTDFYGNSINYLEIRDFLWSKAVSAIYSSDSALVVALEFISKNNTAINNIAVLKFDKSLNQIWKTTYSDNAYLHPIKIIETYDQCYVVVFTRKKEGEFNYDVSIIKLNPFGKIIYKKNFHRYSDDYASGIVETKDFALYVVSTTYSINFGWNLGIARFRNIELTKFKFLNPIKTAISIPVDSILLKGCIKSIKKPKKIEIYVNNVLIDSVKNFVQLKNSKNCDWLFQYNLGLSPGKNIIILKIYDYKNYVLWETRRVYFFPKPTFYW